MKLEKALLVSGVQNAHIALRQLLEVFGFAVVQATNGAQAVEIYIGDPSYDLIVLDSNMPGLSSFSTAKVLRQHQIAKRPCIIGASSNQECSEKVFQSGMDAQIMLPMLEQVARQKPVPLSLVRGGAAK